MRELFFHILNGAAVRIGGAIKRIGSAPGAKYSIQEIIPKMISLKESVTRETVPEIRQ